MRIPIVVSSGGGDGRGGGRVFSRGKGDHVVGDASPRQGCGIQPFGRGQYLC